MAASPSPSSDDPFELGSVLDGRYRIDALLGTGGMGRVYRAEHTKIGKSVAIKVLHADLGRNREASQRFQREAIASGRLDHPNIVGVSDFGVLDDGACYLVMEVLEGESLGDRLAREGRIHWVEAIDILRGVLNGLRHAHERGVVHRDIKPDNVYLARKDGDPIIKILDFGIAKLYAGTDEDPASTRAGLTVGTPAYLSPEQAVGGEITPKSDLYSASIVLYEMLAGRAPFEDKDPLAMLGAHVSRRPPPFAESAPGVDIPPQLEDIMQCGLMKMAAERIGSASDYIAMLDGFSPPIHAMPRFATAPVTMLQTTEALGTMATASPLASLVLDAASGAVRAATQDPNSTTLLPATPVPGHVMPTHATPVPGQSQPGHATPVPGHAMPTHATPAPGHTPTHATPVPGHTPAHATPVPGHTPTHASPVPGEVTSVPAPVSQASGSTRTLSAPVSVERPRLPRATRAVSLADVIEPIPQSWIVRSGVFVGVLIVAAIALAIVSHCGGSSSSPAPATSPASPSGAKVPSPTPPRPAVTAPSAPRPAVVAAPRPAPTVTRPAPTVTRPAPTVTRPAPAVARPPTPSHPPTTTGSTSPSSATAPASPLAAPSATPPPPSTATAAKRDPRDPQLKALLRDLGGGRTCALRKAAIPKLVALRHPGAIQPLRQARYRMTGGVLGLARSNVNACLTAEAERAIKLLSGTHK